MKVGAGLAVTVAVLAIVAGCGGRSAAPVQAQHGGVEVAVKKPACSAAELAGWQKLANRIKAPVFCPGWMPDPFHGLLHDNQWNTIYSISPDHSYLMGFIWLEAGSGELHVNLRGYPGRTRVPICTDTEITGGKETNKPVPCFDDAHGTRTIAGRTFTVYTRNQDADLWHVLYAWHYRGSLYTLSQHVVAPLTYAKVVADLNRMMGSLQVVEPTTS